MLRFEYMTWAKTTRAVTYDLARSGVVRLRREDLPLDFASLDVNGPNAEGYEGLRRAIADRYGVDSRQVVLTQGASFANHLVYAGLLQEGGEVIVEEPAYEVLYTLPRLYHAVVKRLPRRFEDGYQVDLEALEQLVSDRTRLIAVTNLHNPSGALLSEPVLSRMGEIAGRAGAAVLVDEVYLESFYEQRPPVAARLGETFITTSSLTKAYGLDGLRCGWIIAGAGRAEQFRRLNDFFGVIGVFIAEQLGELVFTALDALAALHRPYLTENLRLVTEFVESRPDLEWVRPAGGMVAFPRLKDRASADPLARLLGERHQTTIVPGRFFERPHHFRLAWGLPTETFREALNRLALALEER